MEPKTTKKRSVISWLGAESRVPCEYTDGSGRSHLFDDTLLYYD